MTVVEALLMGVFQGLTEYLPVSSSGHLALLSALFGVEDPEQILSFTVAVHVATVLSTLIVLWGEVRWLVRGLFAPAEAGSRVMNGPRRYALCIAVSMVPVGVVGLLLKDRIEAFFASLLTVGLCLLATSALLAFAHRAAERRRSGIGLRDAALIGLAQAVAVLPGLSRSGATIGTGLLLGCKKSELAQFSFLMVIPPILGEALLDIKDMAAQGVAAATGGTSAVALAVGFAAALVTGCAACRWMVGLVRRGKMLWFAVYCGALGLAVTLWQIFA